MVHDVLATEANSRTSTGSPRTCPWGTTSPVQIILLIFPGKSYGTGAEQIFKKCPPVGTGTKIKFPSLHSVGQSFAKHNATIGQLQLMIEDVDIAPWGSPFPSTHMELLVLIELRMFRARTMHDSRCKPLVEVDGGGCIFPRATCSYESPVSGGRGCLEEGCLGLPGVFPDIFELRLYQSPPKGAGKMAPRENCRKVSKNFWHFLTIFGVFCHARKLSKSVEKLFDSFWRFLTWPLSAGPFCNPLTLSGEKLKGSLLKGSLLKGSFDKACALTCRFLCLSPLHPHTPPLHPFPFALTFHRKTAPHHPPEPDPKPCEAAYPLEAPKPPKNQSRRKIGQK